MEYTFKNLAAIEEGSIKIEENSLNVKFGINGTGKSTISKGITKYIKRESYNNLKKYGSDEMPTITSNKDFDDVIVFNQEYINNYLFKEDLINNSFEIMINTEEYQYLSKKVDNEFQYLLETLKDKDLYNIKTELEQFRNSISFKEKQAKGKQAVVDILGTSKLAKGKKLNDISEFTTSNTKDYQEYLINEKNYEWLKWFEAGYNLILNNKCPFCLNELSPNMNIIHDEISNAFKTTALKQNSESKKILNDVKKYVDSKSKLIISDICKSNEKFSNKDAIFLKEIVDCCSRELDKINNLSTLNVVNIKEMFEKNELINFLINNKLTIDFYTNLENEIKEKIENINSIIDNLINREKEIKTITNDFSIKINSLIKDKCDYVNNFFVLSGIPYKIEVIAKNENDFKTVLKPIKSDVDITKEQLSYGELNSVSLMLFSLEAKKTNGLIILDDPVSSFDNNKKFAILYYLFTKSNAVFKDKTVLLFTHDFSIIIDLIKKHNFRSMKKMLSHITNKDGNLIERTIKNDKVVHTLKQWKSKAVSGQNPLIRVINARKYFEYEACDNNVVDVLSSLLHFNEKPMQAGKNKVMIPDKIVQKAEEKIKELISNFDYDKFLEDISNKENIKNWYFKTNSSVEKLQLIRAYLQLETQATKDDIFMSFITESYHVDNNEFLMLKEDTYDLVPNYILNICDKIMKDN